MTMAVVAHHRVQRDGFRYGQPILRADRYGLFVPSGTPQSVIGRIAPAVLANDGRLVVSAGGGLTAVWIDAAPLALFSAIACGFALFAALNSWIVLRAFVAADTLSRQ